MGTTFKGFLFVALIFSSGAAAGDSLLSATYWTTLPAPDAFSRSNTLEVSPSLFGNVFSYSHLFGGDRGAFVTVGYGTEQGRYQRADIESDNEAENTYFTDFDYLLVAFGAHCTIDIVKLTGGLNLGVGSLEFEGKGFDQTKQISAYRYDLAVDVHILVYEPIYLNLGFSFFRNIVPDFRYSGLRFNSDEFEGTGLLEIGISFIF